MLRFCCIGVVIHLALALPAMADEPPKVDLAGEALPAGAYARFGSARLQHEARAIAFIDAKTIVSYGASLRIYDATTGKMRDEFQSKLMKGVVAGPNEIQDARAATLSGDGKTLVADIGPGLLRVFDATTGKMVGELKGKPSGIAGITNDHGRIGVSADGTRVATCAWDRTAAVGKKTAAVLRVWSVKDGDKPADLSRGELFMDVAIRRDGSRVAALLAGNGEKEGTSLAIWDFGAAKLIRRDELKLKKPMQVGHLAFSLDGTRLAIGGDGGGWAVRDLDGKELWKHDSTDEVVGLYFTPDRQLIVMCETPEEAPTVKAMLADEATGKVIREWLVGKERSPFIQAAVSPDSKLFAITAAGRLRVWSLADGKEIAYSTGHSSAVCTTCITPDGKYIASTDFQDKDIILWDVATGRDVRRFCGHTAGCVVTVLSPDGKRLASSSYDLTVRIWDVASGKELHKLDGFPEPIWHLRFLPDNESIAVAAQDGLAVSVYHAPTGKKVRELAAPKDFAPSALLRHPDGRILVIDSTTSPEAISGIPSVSVQVWDVMSARIVQRFAGLGGRLVCTVLSPDGRTVATRGDDGFIRLWELASGQQRAALNEESMVNSTGTQYFAFSPDGRTIASPNRREPRVYLWDLVSEKPFTSFPAHERPMNTLDFTPDGKRLITGSEDATLLGWDMTSADRRSRDLPRKALSNDDLTKLWETLRNGSAADAYRARWVMVADPDATVGFLRNKFEPPKRAEPEKITTWLSDLDSPKFTKRDAAEKNLMTYIDQAEAELRSLHDKSTGEARKRIARILETAHAGAPLPDVLRELRCVEVLDAIGTKPALDVLREATPDRVHAGVARDAAATLRRRGKD